MSAAPELSVCCSVNTPPGRVAAAFAPLAGLDAEIVLAVDDRVDPAWIAGYREIADRVILVPFPGNFARMYAWMREQCAGRWILQLDLDEVPGAGLAAAVADTIAAGDLTHAWVPRRWLYPDGGRWLAQWPWRPDYALRLVRNDPALLRFPALLHCTVRALGPCRYLRAPLYHADLLMTDAAGRARKLAEYERDMPGFVIDGVSLNEVYYLPERRPDVRLAAVPAEDAAAVAAFLGAGVAVPAGLRRSVPGSASRRRRRASSRVCARDAPWGRGRMPRTWSCSTTTGDSSAASGAHSTSRSRIAAMRCGRAAWTRGRRFGSPTAGAARTGRRPRRARVPGCPRRWRRGRAPSSRCRCSGRMRPARTRSRSTSSTRRCAGSARRSARAWTCARRVGTSARCAHRRSDHRCFAGVRSVVLLAALTLRHRCRAS